MTLDELLRECRARRLFLLPPSATGRRRVTIFAPNMQVSRAIRAAIRAYNHQLAELIDQADVRACYSPDLHRRFYYHAGQQRYRCSYCEQFTREEKATCTYRQS